MTTYLTDEQKRRILQTPHDPGCDWPTRQNKNLALSWSKFEAADQCLRKYASVYITKTAAHIDDRRNLEWGNYVHQGLEKRVLAGTPLPKDLSKYSHVADTILRQVETVQKRGDLAHPIFGEQNWAIGLDGRARKWFDKDVFIRGKADVGWGITAKTEAGVPYTRLILVDYKTGKGKYPKPEQINLMALLAAGQPQFADVSEVRGMLYFVDVDKPVKLVVDLHSWHKVLCVWQAKALAILKHIEENQFPEKQGPLCAYCPDKTCPHNRSES